MFKTFTAGQRLRADIVKDQSTRSDVQGRIHANFVKTFDGDNRGTLLNDIWALASNHLEPLAPDSKASRSLLPAKLYALLQQRLPDVSTNIPPSVLIQQTISLKGVTFSAFENSPGNSNVVYGLLPNGQWSAGRIIGIFFLSHPNDSFLACCVVEPLRALADTDARLDPYRGYRSDVAGKLFYAALEEPIVILATDIVCHFAGTPYRTTSGVDLAHVLPLNRVSDFLNTPFHVSYWHIRTGLELYGYRGVGSDELTERRWSDVPFDLPFKSFLICLYKRSTVSGSTQDGWPRFVTIRTRFGSTFGIASVGDVPSATASH